MRLRETCTSLTELVDNSDECREIKSCDKTNFNNNISVSFIKVSTFELKSWEWGHFFSFKAPTYEASVDLDLENRQCLLSFCIKVILVLV